MVVPFLGDLLELLGRDASEGRKALKVAMQVSEMIKEQMENLGVAFGLR